jgi:hypothetical protein
MKPSGPQIFTAFTSMPMRFAPLLLIPACLLLPAPAGAAVLSTQTSLGTTANNNQTTPGQEVLLIAVVFTGGNLVNGGTVSFADNGNTISGCGSAEINPTNGIAGCDATFSTAGVHQLTATFSGTPEFLASTSETYALSVITTPTVTVQPASSTITTAQPDQVFVTVAGGSGNPTPTGTVVLNSGGYGSSIATLSGGSANITIPAGSLAVGSNTLTATYSPDAANGLTYYSNVGTAPVSVVQAIGSCSTANPNPNPNPESFAAVSDFNGDCKSDILWRDTSTEQVFEWLMNGTALTSTGSPGAPTSDWVIQGVGDFNGDGYADILWRNSGTGEVYQWLMNGTTIASQGTPGTVAPSSGWVIQGVGDFNGDGKADILWRNSTTGDVYIWQMNGTTIASQGDLGIVSPSSGWNIVGVGDFNGDGKADILWQNSTSGEIYIWLMNGISIASQGEVGVVSPSSGWVIQGVGDFDGNGTSDILWQNTTSGEVYIWLMNGTTITNQGSPFTLSPSSGWNIEGVGDYDGSGRAGILWRNSTTEQVYIWLMNGATITSTGSPGTPDASWQIAP